MSLKTTSSAQSQIGLSNGGRPTQFNCGVTFGGANTGATYSINSGTYIQIGNQVNFQLRISMSNLGSNTGSALLVGLPFTANSLSQHAAVAVMASGAFANTINHLQGFVIANSTTIEIDKYSAGATTQLTNSDFTATSTLIIAGCYQT
jgi:hypothetical protein